MNFSDFHSVETYLNSLINYEHTFPLGGARERLKLEPSLQAAARLDLGLRLPRAVHVAGTKGKGSTVAFLEALLAGQARVLSFTSPHIVHVKERVRCNGEVLSDELWQKGVACIADELSREPPVQLTYFETVFVFYLWAARELSTEAHVVEVGLGGRWDATNILQDTLAVITTVDFDHTEILGTTLEAIAGDKAGIIKPRRPLVIGRQAEEALRTILRAADEQHAAPVMVFGADFWWTGEGTGHFRYEDSTLHAEGLTLSALGRHQRDNAAAAVCAARHLFAKLTAEEIRARLALCIIPGRQQILAGRPEVLVDVAHNPISFRALAETLRERFAGRRILAVVGMMKDKDARASLSAIRPFVSELLAVESNSPRARPAQEICEEAEALGMNARCVLVRDEAFAALHSAGDHDLGLVTGSFYLVGDYLLWRQRAGIA
ncbi:MAG: Mur ligase family protein [bacterium]|nr:Mur ligase family protein [bacterium]